jgi:hypothetical protein
MPVKLPPAATGWKALEQGWRLGWASFWCICDSGNDCREALYFIKRQMGQKCVTERMKKGTRQKIRSEQRTGEAKQTGAEKQQRPGSRCRRDRSHAGFACEDIAAKPAEFGQLRSIDPHRSSEAVPVRESSRQEKSPEPRRLRAFRSSCEEGYSAAPSTALVCATVQSDAPTLKRAKRRTVRFSPSLPTFCAISSLMLMAWSLMNGCSRRQTSS